MGKSIIAKIEEFILKHTKPKYMDSKSKVEDFLSKNPKRNPFINKFFKSIDFNGMQVFTFGDEKSENTILYVHGGAFINEINYQHLLYCRKLARKLKAFVFAPVYPLAPHHKAMETFDAITELYGCLLDNRTNITLMGDSAGGGFVLSFCQYLNLIGLSQPEHVIAISPWVDISMSNPPYDNENDPILGEIGLKEIGKSWAGDLDTDDYKVSPIFGDDVDFADALIFAGTNEIFYKDIEKYVEKLENVRFITGQGMFHIYPLFPSPEARKAFKEIKKEILD